MRAPKARAAKINTPRKILATALANKYLYSFICNKWSGMLHTIQKNLLDSYNTNFYWKRRYLLNGFGRQREFSWVIHDFLLYIQ